jgi:GTPase
MARDLAIERSREVTTAALNKALEGIQARLQPPGSKKVGKPPRIYYGTQTGTAPLKFTLFVNDPEAFAPHYRRYLINSLREHFGFKGSPVLLSYKARR